MARHEVFTHVYVAESDAFSKVGITVEIERRLKDLRSCHGCDVRLVSIWEHDYPHRVEAHVKKALKAHRYGGGREFFAIPSAAVVEAVEAAIKDVQRGIYPRSVAEAKAERAARYEQQQRDRLAKAHKVTATTVYTYFDSYRLGQLRPKQE